VSGSPVVDATHEMPVFFRAGDHTLFGILTRPLMESNGSAVLLLPGGAVPLTTARNRLFVRISRSLASHGYHALRLDYHGTGESGGIADAFRLHEPFADDAAGAVLWLREQGLHRVILMGTCFGARTALSVAESEGIVGAILISTPPRDFEMGDRLASKWSLWRFAREGIRPRTLFNILFNARRRAAYVPHLRRKWRALAQNRKESKRDQQGGPASRRISPRFVAQVTSLIERDVPILFIYGEGEDLYEEFKEACSGRLGRSLRHAGSAVEVRTLPGTVHGLTRLAIQDDVENLVVPWAARLVGEAPLSSSRVTTSAGSGKTPSDHPGEAS
jgi:pimeloyl-ACP methyl ester carboxylesterase